MLNVTILQDALFEPITVAQLAAQAEIDAGVDATLLPIYVSAARKVAEKIMRRKIFNQTLQRTLDNFPLAASFDYSPTPADRWNWPIYGGMWNRLAIDLPGGNVLQLPAITYTDQNGNPQTLATGAYSADMSGPVCRLTPSDGAGSGLVWPWQGSFLPGSVQIKYLVGSYVAQVVEQFTVPNVPPYTYTLQQAPCAGVLGVTQGGAAQNGWSSAFNAATQATLLTLPAALAGMVCAATYTVPSLPNDIVNALLLIAAHLYRNREASTDLNLKALPLGVDALLGDYVVEWAEYRPC